jgi:hypothetical protein
MDRKRHEDKQEPDHQDGLREVPGAVPAEQAEETVDDTGLEDVDDEQPELGGSGPVNS